jgi:acetamidase/formamidase/AraC-like DNA-binding protein
MNVLRFSTASYAEGHRDDAWRQCAAEAGLTVVKLADSARFFAHSSVVSTPDGARFLSVSSRPQTLTLEKPEPRAAHLVLLIEGRMAMRQGADAAVEIGPGDVLFGGAADAAFAFTTDFRALFVKLPRGVVDSRLMAPLLARLEVIPAHSAFGQVFAGLLGTAANNLDALSADELRSIETAVTEFLATSVFNAAGARAAGGADARRAALLHRITSAMDARLSDPELSLADVAREHGISPRNLQKLFEVNGQNFTAYLRLRRLEKCRDDLADPRHKREFIAEICYRWGFKDPAYFSRSFRDQFGVSARDFRRAPHLYQEGPVQGWTSRGSPGDVGWTAGRRDDFDQAVAARSDETADAEPVEADALPAGREHHIAASAANVHWGYFSRHLPPVIEVQSGDVVTLECLTHHAYDDYERMIQGDAGAEDVFHWTAEQKTINRRGAGPMDASVFGRGAGEGFGVHICTGPVAVAGARPGDLLEVRILDIEPRWSKNPRFEGRAFGSNAAAFWGFHYDDLLTEPKHREVVTVYELDRSERCCCARAVYNFRWTPQTDPSGVTHARIDYPGIPVDHATTERRYDVLKDVEIPVRPHFGVIGLAPDHSGLVDSVPPSSFGGNLDNWRLGKGASVFLPVAIPGGLLSVGDPHASQGDSEVCGTAIECSLTGRFQLILHKRRDLAAEGLADITYPLIETPDEWVISGFSHPDYLDELGQHAQSEIYKKASVDAAMRDAFRKARRFLMTAKNLSEDEAISLISVAVDFGVTQVVDGNWGVHAVIRKSLFHAPGPRDVSATDIALEPGSE